MRLKGRKIYPGQVQGETLVTSQGISFFGGVDPESGIVLERGHELEGESIAGKILVFPTGKGSTVGSYTLFRLKSSGSAPLAIINGECETITAVGAIIAEIPCVDQVDIRRLPSGQIVSVDGELGLVEILAPANPPDRLAGSEKGSFAEHTMSKRLPDIARKLALEAGRPPMVRERLLKLAEEMPETALRFLRDDGAPDIGLWNEWMAPYVGQNWLETPWFPAETYFFRRILEATGYFQPGEMEGIDPYLDQKREGLKEIARLIEPVCTSIENSGVEPPEELNRLLHTVIWGNQADLSIWPAGSEPPANHEADARTAHLLVDQSRRAAEFIMERRNRLHTVDFILDNVGLELAYDLLLADTLLKDGLAERVRFHAKPYPTYVSDATLTDIHEMVNEIAQANVPSSRQMGERLKASLAENSLELLSDYSWISTLACWEMPKQTRRTLQEADLLISKGDANYRRWVGDRHWAFDTPLETIAAYRPAPLLLLRVLKSELVVGLQPGQGEAMSQIDPEWMYNGNWGLIQFVP